MRTRIIAGKIVQIISITDACTNLTAGFWVLEKSRKHTARMYNTNPKINANTTIISSWKATIPSKIGDPDF